MSYIVTARKWRPQFFRDVISQKHVTDTLMNAIKSNRVGHAYLFSGPRGVGKTTVARIFAKALNCEHGPSEEPCNACENCHSIQAGYSMDVQEIDGASHNSVEDIRDIIANVGYHASHSRYKMYIVDEVHMLSTQAFNALLKTLEEPPPNVIFVFATTEPHKIPATILSRCQRFDFHRLSVHEIAGKLRTIAEADSIEIDDESIMLIAQRATGAMRDGESILEQLKSSRGGSVTIADVTEVLGIADRDVFFRIMERCHKHDVHGSFEIFTDYYDEGGDLKEFIEGLLGHLRDLLYACFEDGLKHVMLSEDMKSRIKEQSEWFCRDDIIRMIGFVTDVETSLRYAVIPVLSIEVALARMVTMESTIQLKDLFEKLSGESAQAPLSVPDVPTAHKRATVENDKTLDTSEMAEVSMIASNNSKFDDSGREAMVTSPDPKKIEEAKEPEYEYLNITPDIDSITSSWKAVVDRITLQKPALGPSLLYAAPESFSKGKLTLSFKDTFHLKTVESSRATLEEFIGAFLGTKISIEFKTRSDTAKQFDKPVVGKKSETDDLTSREPIIKDLLERFDGEINDTWRE